MAGANRDPEVQALLDKQAITEVIYRYCRGLDRMDVPLTLSCWHPGGTDDHGALYTGSAEGFVEWLWPVHAAMERTQHTIHNILIELDADDAYSESYYIVYLRAKGEDGMQDIVGAGRYCDHFQRRNGEWKIAHRQAVSDWLQLLPVPSDGATGDAIPPNNPDHRSLVGRRDKEDYSYFSGKGVFG